MTKIKLPVSFFVYVSRIFDSIKETFQRKTCLGEVMQQDTGFHSPVHVTAPYHKHGGYSMLFVVIISVAVTVNHMSIIICLYGCVFTFFFCLARKKVNFKPCFNMLVCCYFYFFVVPSVKSNKM